LAEDRTVGLQLRRWIRSRGSPYAFVTVFFILTPLIIVVGGIAFVWTVFATDTSDAFNIALGYVSPLKDKAGPEGVVLAIIAFLFVPAAMGAIVSLLFDRIGRPATIPQLEAIERATTHTPSEVPARTGPTPSAERTVARPGLRDLVKPRSSRLIPTLRDVQARGTSDEKDFVRRFVGSYLATGIDEKTAWREAEKTWLNVVGSMLWTKEVWGDMQLAVTATEQLISTTLAESSQHSPG
jgi:hypothetical protein